MSIFKPLLALASAWACTALQAQVECSVACPKGTICELDPPAALYKAPSLYRFATCDRIPHTVKSPATLWYPHNGLLAKKTLAPGSSIAAAVSDGDRSCGGFDCLFRKKPGGRAIGGNPMGDRDNRLETPEPLIQTGLPFADVTVPDAGLAIRPRGAAPGARMTLMDRNGRVLGVYDASPGVFTLPGGLLEGGAAYRYQWASGGTAAEGSFRVAFARVARKAEEEAHNTAGASASAAEQAMALAAAYQRVGLHWNAMKAIADLADGRP